MSAGTLTVVGTGYNVAGQVTPEALSAMRSADRLHYLMSDPASSAWLRSIHPNAESLDDCYRTGEASEAAFGRMVERILASVRGGHRTCAAFYGHPAILVPPGLESVRRAREEGFATQLLPAISFEDCLYADLGFDPGISGRVMYAATDFIVRPRRIDPSAAIVLLQVGAIGLSRFRVGDDPNREGLSLLVEVLSRSFPLDHEVVLYRMSQSPLFDPAIDRVPLEELPRGPLSVVSTLFVPPLPRRRVVAAVLQRIQGLAARA